MIKQIALGTLQYQKKKELQVSISIKLLKNLSFWVINLTFSCIITSYKIVMKNNPQTTIYIYSPLSHISPTWSSVMIVKYNNRWQKNFLFKYSVRKIYFWEICFCSMWEKNLLKNFCVLIKTRTWPFFLFFTLN